MKKVFALVLVCALLMTLLTGCACKHANTELQRNAEPTCTEAGYTGDTYCLDCKKVIEEGKKIDALGHTAAAERVNASEPTCTAVGNTGDVLCSVCGETLEAGEEIAALGHVPAEERVNTVEPGCVTLGNTGDVPCTVCGEVVEAGEKIDALGHKASETRVNVAEATCETAGYTGDVVCAVCGEILEEGDEVEETAHTPSESRENVVEATAEAEGYTGDIVCTVCGEVMQKGEVIAKIEAAEPAEAVASGLYDKGEMTMTWAELIENGYVEVDGAKLVKVSNRILGTMVVDESIMEVDNGAFRSVNLKEICLPASIGKLKNTAFMGAVLLKSVHYANPEVEDQNF